ncbi:hypothetical protein D3C75_963350 [compost metagenome]
MVRVILPPGWTGVGSSIFIRVWSFLLPSSGCTKLVRSIKLVPSSVARLSSRIWPKPSSCCLSFRRRPPDSCMKVVFLEAKALGYRCRYSWETGWVPGFFQVTVWAP